MTELIHYCCRTCDLDWSEPEGDDGLCPKCDNPGSELVYEDAATIVVVTHTPACEQLLTQWQTHPAADIEHRLAEYARTHTDPELCDLVITMLDEDHGTSAEQLARALWPVLTHEVTT